MTAIAEKALHHKAVGGQPILAENYLDALNNYTDKTQISSWARNSVAITTCMNLVNGKGDNQFDPNGISTRSEGAAVIKRLYAYINRANKNILSP